MFLDFIKFFENYENYKIFCIPEIIDSILISKSCKNAIKFNDIINQS